MPYLYLVFSAIFIASSGIIATFFNNKTKSYKNTTSFYYVFLSASMFLSWFLYYIFNFSFDIRVLPYSILFFVFFSGTFIFELRAIQAGPTSLTSLMLQFSLIAVTLYCIIVKWPNAKFSLLVVIGLILVILSVTLCLYEGKSNKGLKITKKWLVFATLLLISNAGSAIIQKEQQIRFDGQHGSMLMTVACFFFFIYSLIMYIRSDKSEFKNNGKVSVFPIIAGVFNFGLNFLVILLAQQTLISPSVVYPVIAVGGLMCTMLFASLIFKERLAWWQWIGIAVGITAVTILNI